MVSFLEAMALGMGKTKRVFVDCEDNGKELS